MIQTRLTTKTQVRIQPQQVLISHLLQVSGADIEQLISRELASNPALEPANEGMHTAGERLHRPRLGSSADRSRKSSIRPYAAGNHLGLGDDWGPDVADFPSQIEVLTSQLALMVEGSVLEIATYLIHCLDERGYLRETPQAVADGLGVDPMAVERAIKVLHDLEPPGIGARDVRECLLIQCRHLEGEGIDCTLARRAITEAWEELCSSRWSRAAAKLRLSQPAMEQVREFIARNLYPHPGLILDGQGYRVQRYPWVDLIVHRQIGDRRPRYVVELPGEEAYELRISGTFDSILRNGPELSDDLTAEDRVWVRDHVDRARMFLCALDQRWSTLRQVGEYLVDYQAGFLDHGPLSIKPLTRASVAQELGLHESTVSRAANQKMIQLPGGRIIPLSDFFDSSLAVKEAMREVMSSSSKILSDRELAEQLHARGFSVARRTVAKYRSQMRIASSHERR